MLVSEYAIRFTWKKMCTLPLLDELFYKCQLCQTNKNIQIFYTLTYYQLYYLSVTNKRIWKSSNIAVDLSDSHFCFIYEAL